MKPSFLALIPVLAVTAFCGIISISKDSLWISYSIVFSRYDTILIKNIGADSVKLDSAILMITEIDTTRFGRYISNDLWRVFWQEKGMNCIWKLSAIQTNKYALVIENKSPPDSGASLSMGPDDSTFFGRFELGFCFYCGSYPTYPLFWKGLLDLHFSNGQKFEIKLYSSDLRTRILTNNSRRINHNMGIGAKKTISLNGKTYNQSSNLKKAVNINVSYSKERKMFNLTLQGR